MTDRQTTNTVLMIRPARFFSNPETAASNAFQKAGGHDLADIQANALAEFDGLVAALEGAGIRVLVYPDTASPEKPDAVFPNNWLSTHADGAVVMYPMQAANRRLERRRDIADDLQTTHGFAVERVVDLSGTEEREQYLEGTGSMVLDRENRIAYACRSPRTHPEALANWGKRFGYEVIAFDAESTGGRPIYHTNVMMGIGARLAVVCLAAIPADRDRQAVRARLTESGHEILDISLEQMAEFAGNMLELSDAQGQSIFVMSQRAHDSLSEAQRATIGRHSRIVSVPIATIEDSAGGSVRCMIAEIFLPERETRSA